MRGLSRRALFGAIAASPVAAAAAVGSAAPDRTIKCVVELDTSQIDLMKSNWNALRAMVRAEVVPTMALYRAERSGDWRQ